MHKVDGEQQICTGEARSIRGCPSQRVASVSQVLLDDMEQFGDAEFTTVQYGSRGFGEVCSIPQTGKVSCCHFSSDGKFLASAGCDKKVFIWNMEIGQAETTTEKHSDIITDVRFRYNSTQLATSSLDKTVKIWDASNPGYCQQTMTGHSERVRSLDFHPKKTELFCSCDSKEIRYWNSDTYLSVDAFEAEWSLHVRFQPQDGKFLAAAFNKTLAILDVETGSLLNQFKGHDTSILSVCWDRSGKYVASVSKDSARLWTLDTRYCSHELCPDDGELDFYSCVFHPSSTNILVIGGRKSLNTYGTRWRIEP